MDKKQKNKPFKGKSKGKQKGGRVEKSGKSASIRNMVGSSREERRNASRVRQIKSRERATSGYRGPSARHPPPKLVGVLSLSPETSVSDICRVLLKEAAEPENVIPEEGDVVNLFPKTIRFPKWKTRCTVVPLHLSDKANALEVSKIVDLLILVVPASSSQIDENPVSQEFLSSIKAQGMPSVLVALVGMDTLIPGAASNSSALTKARQEAKKRHTARASHLFTDEAKILQVAPANASECTLFIRAVALQKIRHITWKEGRPSLLADSVQLSEHDPLSQTSSGGINPSHFSLHPQRSEGTATLCVTGYVRGKAIAPNRLLHLTDFGCFKVSKVVRHNDPFPLNPRKEKSQGAMDMDDQESEGLGETFAPDPNKQDGLEVLNPDEGQAMMEELLLKDKMLKKSETGMEQKKVPAGTSVYQSAWILEPEEDDLDDEEDEDEEGMVDNEDGMADSKEEEEEREWEEEEEEEDHEWIRLTEQVTKEDDVNLEMEEENRKRELEDKIEEDLVFPDEVDSPFDEAARARFIKYRGLKSFRKSPWDPKESLPFEYANIHQFANFNRSKKFVTKEEDPEQSKNLVPMGAYVSVYITGVPRDYPLNAYGACPGAPGKKSVILFGMFQHENKMSVMNMVVRKHSSYPDPLTSKEELEAHIGPYRFPCRPIFSENSFNADKHKYEKFLHDDRVSVASIYGPVSFPPSPVLFFKTVPGDSDEDPPRKVLVATGTLKGVNPDRIILKRITLTGHPFKVHKKKAIVRNMFYFPEDIRWFKPVELRTKYGRVGHITEPLGTHGYMKCLFDGNISQADTVCLHLYKRVYPVSWKKEYS